MKSEIIIEPQQGLAIEIKKTEKLKIVDIEGQQVVDLLAFNLANLKERLSTAATIEINKSLNIKTSDCLYSNMYKPMIKIIEDTVGAHDLLHLPCSADMYRCLYGIENDHPNCYNNYLLLLKKYGIDELSISTPFNIFMNTQVYKNGQIEVKKPLSKPGDYILLEPKMDLLIAVTACSEESICNAFKCSSIKLEILV